MATAHQELQTLWAEAYDAWKDVPGHSTPTVYFCPEAASSVPPEGLADIPKVAVGSVIYALTSWNPMGQPAPMEANQATYKQLSHDLKALNPRHVMPSFGFNATGYRENGFCVVFDETDLPQAKDEILAVAAQYGQGAIYEFRFVANDPKRLLRRTVPVLIPDVEADVAVVVCPRPSVAFADPDLYFDA